MAPELVEDPRFAPSTSSDVYSFSITAWEIISRRLPCHNDNGEMQHDVMTLKTMIALVSGLLRPDLAAVRADCPPALVALLQRCWDSEARKRPAIAVVADEVGRIVAALGGDGGADFDALPGQLPLSP